MANFKVVFEIEVDARTPLQAAKTIQQWFDDADTRWQFYVKRSNGRKVYSVDLEEPNSEAVLPVSNYEPMIKAV